MRYWIIGLLVVESFLGYAQTETKSIIAPSGENVLVNYFKCEKNASDSLLVIKNMVLSLKVDALSDTIINSQKYILQFSNRIKWETDFK
jgi:septum formation inhibitor-activating ATPase MinD